MNERASRLNKYGGSNFVHVYFFECCDDQVTPRTLPSLKKQDVNVQECR